MRSPTRRVMWAVVLAVLLAGIALQPSAARGVQAATVVKVSPTHWHVAHLGGVADERSATYAFDGVSCPSPRFCLMVATEWVGSSTLPIVERWNGKAWGRLGLGRTSDAFDAVACATVSYCMVVGMNAKSRPLAERYAGGRWTRTVVQRTNDELDAVACPRPGTCLVVGTPNGGWPNDPILSWELRGGRWRWVPVALRIKALDDPSAMSCVSTVSCEFVGGYTYGGPGGSGFIERFDGRTWRPDETQVSYRGGFGNVSCLRTGLCVATEDLPASTPADDSGGLSGIVTQARVHRRWVTLGRGLPGPDQLIVAESGVQCFEQGWCVVTAGGDKGMFVAAVIDEQLQPLAVVRGVHLHGIYPWLSTLACAGPSFCVETSESAGSPYVLMGSVAPLAP